MFRFFCYRIFYSGEIKIWNILKIEPIYKYFSFCAKEAYKPTSRSKCFFVILTLVEEDCSKVKVIGHSSRSSEENVDKETDATATKDYLVS